MVVLIDPTGTGFALWQSKSNDLEGAIAIREAYGMFCWQKFMTSNVDQTANFYKYLLSWDYYTMGGIAI